MEVRPAADDDAPSVTGLLEELGYPSDVESVRRRIERFTSSVRDEVFVAETQGRVVGMAAASISPRVGSDTPFARITALVVGPSSRRMSVGRLLVLTVEEWAVAAGCALIQVTSGQRPERAAANRFYPALGYKDLHDEEALYEKSLRT